MTSLSAFALSLSLALHSASCVLLAPFSIQYATRTLWISTFPTNPGQKSLPLAKSRE